LHVAEIGAKTQPAGECEWEGNGWAGERPTSVSNFKRSFRLLDDTRLARRVAER